MSRARVGTGCAILATLFLGVACGGGGGGDDGPPTYNGTAYSTGTLDGWVRSDLTYSASGAAPPHAGDFDAGTPGLTARAYYSFNLGGLSPTAEILSAQVRLHVTAAQGNPFAEHGDLIAAFFPYGNSLANVLTTAVMGGPPPSPFSPADTSTGTKTADVTEIMRHALAGGASQVQIQVGFGSGIPVVNGVSDFLELTDAENVAGVGAEPTLTFTWREP